MRKTFATLLFTFFFALPVFAAAPVCLFSDVASGPAMGGEGGNGIYLNIYGMNFGSTQGRSIVTVNGTPVAQYLYWGADPTGDRQQIGVQVAAATTGTGSIVVTTPEGSCSNLSFAVRTGKIWFIGPSVDNSTPGTCATMEAANSYSTPWGLTNYASTTESNYNYTTMRTPFTYYHCMSPGDTLVFLNGVNYPYFDGRGWHSSLTLDSNSTTSSTFMTVMARPGATAALGGEGWAMAGIRNAGIGYSIYSGLTLTGSGANGMGLAMSANDRAVGNTIHCPSCWGPTGAMIGGTAGNVALGNSLSAISTDTTVLPNGSNKTYHASYFAENNFEFGWNRIYNTAAYNGFQVNHDASPGFFNFTIHDNDIADVYGSGINLSTIDPSSGYVQVYNNVIHHTGLNIASDGGGGDPHSCLAVKGYGNATGIGTVEMYNNTMYDCNSYLNLNVSSSASCAVLVLPNQLNVTTNLVNNIAYQPAYAGTAKQNVYICGGGSVGTISGSNNIWYSDSTPGSTAHATTVGTIENPLFVSPTDGSWTHFELQGTSPAIGAGTEVGPVESQGASNTYLMWDFNHVARPSLPAIGALEYGSTSSQEQFIINVAPNQVNPGQPITLTATVAQTGSTVPSGSFNFLNGGVSLGQASLDSEGTATLVLSWLPVGSYQVEAAYSGDSSYPSGISAIAPLQVLYSTTTGLAASPSAPTAGQPLTLTATVEGNGGTASAGTVNFLNGYTLLGTATLNASGVATLPTASLPAGTYRLTAHYTGNSSFFPSTSSGVSVTVSAQASTVASPFSVDAGTSTPSQTVLPGGTAVYALTVSPAAGTTLPAISLAASGLPAGAIATFSPAKITAGSGATSVTLSIQVPPVQSAMLERNSRLGGGMSFLVLGFILMPFGGGIRRSGKRMMRLSCMMVLLFAGAVSLVGLSGCASGFSSPSAQTYTVTVTSTAASVSHTTTVNLTVE